MKQSVSHYAASSSRGNLKQVVQGSSSLLQHALPPCQLQAGRGGSHHDGADRMVTAELLLHEQTDKVSKPA